MQIRREFLAFCIGYCFADAEVDEINKSDKEVKALMKIKVGKMLKIFKQPMIRNEELQIFDSVNSWIYFIQQSAKKGY